MFSVKTILVSVTIACIIFCQCKKEQITKCEANCVSLTVTGKIVDGSANKQPKANVTVSINWSNGAAWSIFPQPAMVVGKATTNADGEFAAKVEIDSSLFNSKYLYVQVNPSTTNSFVLPEEHSMFDFTPAQFQNLEFEHYDEALIKIRLKSYASKVYSGFRLECETDVLNANPFDKNYYTKSFNHLPKDTTIQHMGIAGVETIVKFSKTFNGNTTAKVFNIYPKKNKINEYLIEYD